jgi:hypothetical protein
VLGPWRYRMGAHDQKLNINVASQTVVCQP